MLIWEKCHFMVKQGIVLAHVISHQGIEVDKAKVDLISNLPPPLMVKEFALSWAMQVSIGNLSGISARSLGPCVSC